MQSSQVTTSLLPSAGAIENAEPAAKRRKVGGKKKAPFTSEQHQVRMQIVAAAKDMDQRAGIQAYDEAKSRGRLLEFTCVLIGRIFPHNLLSASHGA